MGGGSCPQGHKFESHHCIRKYNNICLTKMKPNEKEAGDDPLNDYALQNNNMR